MFQLRGRTMENAFRILRFLITLALLGGFLALRADTQDGIVTGLIKDTAAKPVGGATVFLNSESQSVRLRTTTEPRGTFRFGNVAPAQDYELQIVVRGETYNCDRLLEVALYEAMVVVPDPVVPAGQGAQEEPVEELYKRAVGMYGHDNEGACDLFHQIEQRSPNYKGTRGYMESACAAKDEYYKNEKDLTEEGIRLFTDGKYAAAKDKFLAAQKSSSKLKQPKYRDEINSYLGNIATIEGETAQFDGCVSQFNEQQLAEAQSCFTPITNGGGLKASEARRYLAKIKDALAYNDGRSFFDQGKYGDARAKLNQVVQGRGAHANDATELLGQMDRKEGEQLNRARSLYKQGKDGDAYKLLGAVAQGGGQQAGEAQALLARIDNDERTAISDARTLSNQKEARDRLSRVANSGGPHATEAKNVLAGLPAPPTPPQSPVAGEEALRAGLKAYFQGQYDEAEQDLSAYLEGKGKDREVSYLFRGAVHLSRYYLSGETDTKEKNLALDDFRSVRGHKAQLKRCEKYLSPKVLAVYRGAP